MSADASDDFQNLLSLDNNERSDTESVIEVFPEQEQVRNIQLL